MKRVLLVVALVVACGGAAWAGNLAGQAELAKYGFRVIETADLFMLKYHAPVPAPLLRIERLPGQFQLPAGEKSLLRQRLEARRLTDRTADDPAARVKYLQLEKAIETQAQAAYTLSLDVNLDGTPDVFIGPYVEHLALNDTGASVEQRRPFGAVQRDRMVNLPIRWTWLVTVPGSPLMPVFDKAEFFIREARQTPALWPSSFALQDYPGVRGAQRLAVPAIAIEPLADGNLVISVERDGGEPIQVRTHFAWQD